MKTLSRSLLIALALMSIASTAISAQPQVYGTIKEINLYRSWIVVGSHRLLVTPHTQIRNLSTGGDYLRALQAGQPVLYDAGPEHELIQIRAYPVDLEQRKRFLSGEFIELHP